MAVFDPSLYSATAPASEFPGVTWTGRDSDVPRSGVKRAVNLLGASCRGRI